MQFINNLRGLAILLIMLVHSIATIKQVDSIWLTLLSTLLNNCSVIFVVIAGYFFSFQIIKFNYWRFFYQNLVPLFCRILSCLYQLF